MSQIVQAQISSFPPFPQRDGGVTIFFDASLGSRGLMGYDGDVYAHTGVITDQSNSSSDWKYVKTDWGQNTPETKLTRVNGDVYRLDIDDIESYYGVPQDEEILQMAFVFRSATQVNGAWLEGKDANLGDLFVDIYSEDDGFQVVVDRPINQDLIFTPNSPVQFLIYASRPANFEIKANGTVVHTAEGVSSIDHTVTNSSSGTTLVEINVESGSEQWSRTFSLAVAETPNEAPLPDGAILGREELSDSRIRLVLEAPGINNVVVRGWFSNWRINTDFTMNRTPDGRYHWIEIDGLQKGEFYSYQYILMEERANVPDPFSELILDPFNDPFISESLFPNLPPQPDEDFVRDTRISLFKMGGFEYDWQVENFEAPPKENLVVYECLVRDFLEDHSYSSLRDTLDYLQSLGINAIELMPVQEFEGNISWGYNPSFHMALDKYYGNPFKFKQFVDACHERGIAVIVDVVFNHVYGESPLARMWFDFQAGKPAFDNPYLNRDARHPFNVGYDVNHESESTKDWVKRVVQYWLEEYRIDGYRFDLSKGFTQTNNPNDVGAWGRYDATRIATLKRIADEVWEINPDAYVILEHLSENAEERELAEYGMMLWGNMHFNFKEASLGYHDNNKSNFSGAYHGQRGWDVPHLVSYMESHDEQRLAYENQSFGNSNGNYNVKDFSTAMDRLELASAFLYTIPGPKMLWQFGELGYDFPINWCEDGSIQEGCRTGPKPIRWDYTEVLDRADLYDVTRDLINLKTRSEINEAEITGAQWVTSTKYMVLEGDEVDVVVIGNFDVEARNLSVTFPQSGTWYRFFAQDEVNVPGTQNFLLQPGEYEIYTTKRYGRVSQNMTVGTRNILPESVVDINIFPNPSTNGQIRVEIDRTSFEPEVLRVVNAYGQVIHTERLNGQLDAEYQLNRTFGSGTYYLVLSASNGQAVERFVVQR